MPRQSVQVARARKISRLLITIALKIVVISIPQQGGKTQINIIFNTTAGGKN